MAGMVVAGGLSVSGSAFAGDAIQQLFVDNNQQLTDELAKMSCVNESAQQRGAPRPHPHYSASQITAQDVVALSSVLALLKGV